LCAEVENILRDLPMMKETKCVVQAGRGHTGILTHDKGGAHPDS
jgi:hypothetical protein